MKTCNLFTVKNTPNEVRSCKHEDCVYYVEYAIDYDDADDLQYSSVSDIIEMIYYMLDDVFIHMICGGFICKMYNDGRKQRIYAIVVDATVSEVTFVRVKR